MEFSQMNHKVASCFQVVVLVVLVWCQSIAFLKNKQWQDPGLILDCDFVNGTKECTQEMDGVINTITVRHAGWIHRWRIQYFPDGVGDTLKVEAPAYY